MLSRLYCTETGNAAAPQDSGQTSRDSVNGILSFPSVRGGVKGRMLCAMELLELVMVVWRETGARCADFLFEGGSGVD